MHNTSFPQPNAPGAQARPPANPPQGNTPPAVVPVTQPAPQQPVIEAQAATPNLLQLGAMKAQAQQTASVTAAPLFGAGAGSKRNAPDSGFDRPIDGNDAQSWAAPLGPQIHEQLQPQGFPWFQPAPLPSSSSVGDMYAFGGHLNTGIPGPVAGGRFFASTRNGSGWALALPGMPFHGMPSSSAGVPPALTGAVLHGDMRAVYLLLADPHTNVNISDGMGYTALMHAANKGDLSLILALLSRPEIDVHARGMDGLSAFDLARSSWNVFTFQILSSVTTARANGPGTPGVAYAFPPIVQAPFIPPAVDATAARAKNSDMPPLPNESTKPALIRAVEQGDLHTIRALRADPGIDVNARDADKSTALHHASSRKNHAAVALLLEGPGIDINARDKRGQTALHSAVQAEDPVTVALLLAAPGIDVNARDKSGRTAMHHAANERCGSDIIGPLLAATGIAPHAEDYWGGTAFDIALRQATTNTNEVIRPLFASRVEAEGVTANTRLALAAAKGELSLVEALLAEPDIDVNARSYGGNTALMLAAFHGHEAVVRRLLTAPGIDVNARDDYGVTALYLAAENGSGGVLRSLLNAPGININAYAFQRGTALMGAARKGNEKAFFALLAMPGIDIRFGGDFALQGSDHDFNYERLFALKFAVAAKESILGALLAMPGVDINEQSYIEQNEYSFPLIEAACLGREVNVRLLLAMPDINVNASNHVNASKHDGDTALLAAVKEGHEAVVRALLAMPGIRIAFTDKDGNTALSIAMKKGHDAIAKALRNYVPAKPAEPATVLRLLQSIFTTHSGKPQQNASSSADSSLGVDTARTLDKLCESLQFGKCAAADVPALFTTAGSLPASAHSALALALAFGFYTGHYRNADGALDEAIAAAIDKAGLRTNFDDTVEKLGLAAKHINLCRIDGMNLLGIAAKDGNERMIRGLVRLGAYVNVPSPNGKTALAIAVENRQWGACAELVFHGALPTLPIHDGYPALYHIVRDFNTDAHASESLALLIRYLRMKGVSFDIRVKNPVEAMRAERPTVPLHELLFTNAQSLLKYRHILFDQQDAAPPAVPAPTTTAAIPGNGLSAL